MKQVFFGLIVLMVTAMSCKKEPAPPVVVSVPEKLEVSPAVQNVIVGSTVSYTVKYFNNLGVQATVPSNIVWSSSNTAIATVNAQGVVSGVGVGQTEIKVTLGNTVGTALVTVVANANQLAAVNITPSSVQEILLNGTTALTATGTNSAGGMINNLMFNWNTNASNVVTVNASGMATGVAYGSANITATANMIQSAPVEVQVIRRGTLSGAGSAGTLKLKNVSGVIKLESSANYFVSGGAPDLRLYLTNTPNPTSLAGALQVVDLANPSQYSGAHSWNMPSSVTMTNYRYVFVWCAQFGGNYGNCDLGQ